MTDICPTEPPIEPSLEPWLVSHHELVVKPGMHCVAAGHVGMVLAIGVLILTMLASEPLLNWANRLPAHPIAEAVIAGVQAWNGAMQTIGMTDLFAALKDFFAALRAL